MTVIQKDIQQLGTTLKGMLVYYLVLFQLIAEKRDCC